MKNAAIDYVKLQTGHYLTATEVQSLNERVQDWVAGLTLLLRRSHPARTPPPLVTVELVFDYFAAEVWNQLDPTLQTFLLKIALLPKMIAAMVDQLTDGDRAEALLNELVRSHCFTLARR